MMNQLELDFELDDEKVPENISGDIQYYKELHDKDKKSADDFDFWLNTL